MVPMKGYYPPTQSGGAGSLDVCVSKNVFQEVPGPGENISELGHWQEAYLAIMKI